MRIKNGCSWYKIKRCVSANPIIIEAAFYCMLRSALGCDLSLDNNEELCNFFKPQSANFYFLLFWLVDICFVDYFLSPIDFKFKLE